MDTLHKYQEDRFLKQQNQISIFDPVNFHCDCYIPMLLITKPACT